MYAGLRKYPSMFSLLCACTLCSCHSDSAALSSAYDSYRFDPKVIENLPIYDSLVAAIAEKISLIQQHIDTTDAYQSFRYRPGSHESGVFNKLPEGAGPKIDHHFAKLGKDFIYRVDVFRDSTVKIYIRNRPAETGAADIEENLSYYPREGTRQPRPYPARDTMLTGHWQYWMRVNERRLF